MTDNELQNALAGFTSEIKRAVERMTSQQEITNKLSRQLVSNTSNVSALGSNVSLGGIIPNGYNPGSFNSLLLGGAAALTGQTRQEMANSSMGNFLNMFGELFGGSVFAKMFGMSTGQQTADMTRSILQSIANSSNASSRGEALSILSSTQETLSAVRNDFGRMLSDLRERTKISESDLYKFLQTQASSGNLNANNFSGQLDKLSASIDSLKVFGAATRTYEMEPLLRNIQLLTGKMDVNVESTRNLTDKLFFWAGGDRDRIPAIANALGDSIKQAILSGFTHSQAVAGANYAMGAMTSGVAESERGAAVNRRMELFQTVMDSELSQAKTSLGIMMKEAGASNDQIQNAIERVSTVADAARISEQYGGRTFFNDIMRLRQDQRSSIAEGQGISDIISQNIVGTIDSVFGSAMRMAYGDNAERMMRLISRYNGYGKESINAASLSTGLPAREGLISQFNTMRTSIDGWIMQFLPGLMSFIQEIINNINNNTETTSQAKNTSGGNNTSQEKQNADSKKNDAKEVAK